MTEREIFDVALAITDEAERSAYLDSACGDDLEMREHIIGLLKAHGKLGSFLDSPAPDLSPTEAQDTMGEGPGAMIGKYKLLQEIGEGGMGTVFMAEQTEPVKRRVALKIIKPGMDSKQVVARFEAERQALAMMDHPNIAKVLDAGTTDSGRPFFVMELVKGIPITKYCDEHHLTPRERLKLFTSVCLAVQHAHQKGVIHRDLKPSNVLVAHYDSQPVVKVIDFGVAKATGQQLTEKTLFTQFGQIVGTLEYMSPEQARFNQLDIDTRSDIYSLGVLLYELLTGVTPFDRDRLKTAAFDEVLRIIREEEPPKPSTRVSIAKNVSSMTVDRCSTEPKRLFSILHGDLDWLVMKALSKERDRRYETASGLAADIGRYLGGEAIEARPPSNLYRLTKMISRHRAFFSTVVLVLALTISAAAGIGYFALRAHRIAAELRVTLTHLLVTQVLSGDENGVKDTIGLATIAGVPTDSLQTMSGLGLLYTGNVQQSIDYFEQAHEQNPDDDRVLRALACAYLDAGRSDRAWWLGVDLSRQNDVPNNDLDILLHAHATMAQDPERALELITTLTDRGPHLAIAYVVRAHVRLCLAQRLQQHEQIELALEDISKARQVLGNRATVDVAELRALVTAFRMLGGEHANVGEWRERGDVLANRLMAMPNYVLGSWTCAQYFKVTAQDHRAEEAFMAAIDLGFGGPWVHACVAYERGEGDEALKIVDLEANKLRLYYIAQLHILLDKELDIEQTLSEAEHAGLAPKMILRMSLLLEGAAKAMQRAKAYLLDDPINPTPQFYARDEIDEETIASDFVYWSGEVHIDIAFRYLAVGDHQNAKEHFQLVVEEGAYGSLSFHTASAYLNRLNKEDGWLPMAVRLEGH